MVLKRKVLDKEDKSSRIKKQPREKKQGEKISYNAGDMIPGYTGYIAKSEKVAIQKSYFCIKIDHFVLKTDN